MKNTIYFRKAIHTKHGAIFEKNPLPKKEQAFNDYINKSYAVQAAEVGKVFKKRLHETINKVTCDSYYGAAVLSVIQETPRYAYIKNCDCKGNFSEDSDIEIDLLNHTYSEI